MASKDHPSYRACSHSRHGVIPALGVGNNSKAVEFSGYICEILSLPYSLGDMGALQIVIMQVLRSRVQQNPTHSQESRLHSCKLGFDWQWLNTGGTP